jgi:hypothetical protein
MMTTIAAANNVNITLENGEWSLTTGSTAAPTTPTIGGTDTSPLVRATKSGLSYTAPFASARRLPITGLPIADISMVVLGWAYEDNAWHLGVLLTPRAAEERGGRWCGLARWDTASEDEARSASSALADVLGVSYHVVPPPTQRGDLGVLTAPAESTPAEPSAPPIPLMPLPIVTGEWELRELPNESGAQWQRTSAWRKDSYLRVAFLFILAPIFAMLSIGSLLTPFAPVQPSALPFVGLALAAILLLLSLSQLFGVLRSPVFIVDTRQKMVRHTSGKRTVMQVPFEGVEYVLTSHVTNRRTPKTGQILAEAWVHLHSPRRGFLPVVYVHSLEGKSDAPILERTDLDLHLVNTPLHHAAQIVADMIGVPAFVEER